MQTLLLSLLLLTPVPDNPPPPVAKVADRSEPVCVALESQLNKNRQDITAADLKKVTELKLPHIHIKSFKDHDFAGLTNLKKLNFFSLLHNQGRPQDPIAIGPKVFGELPNLEELIINEQLGQLPDDVFSGLKSLKILDMGTCTLNRLPRSLLTLPKIEKVYFAGRGMSPADLETLKAALGDKYEARRIKK